MKILPISKIREADQYTIKNEPIASIDLMERAAIQCSMWLSNNFEKSTVLNIFCGKGNNGGDGLAIARIMTDSGFAVKVYIVEHTNNKSQDFEININRLNSTQISVLYINDSTNIQIPDSNSVIIDALLGSGLNKPTEGIIKDTIQFLNKLPNYKVSIDIPSGLFSDTRNSPEDTIFQANTTLTFQLPKLSFLFAQNHKYVGNFVILPIGLSDKFIDDIQCNNHYVDKVLINEFYKVRGKYSHKGNYGHTLLVTGSYGKMGAAVLCAKACLKSGAGLVSVHCPSLGVNIIQNSIPEAMVEADINEKYIICVNDIEKYNVIAVGPGIGTETITKHAFENIVKNSKKPLIIDADGINILSENKALLTFLPKNSILTPHVREFERLTHKFENEFDRFEFQKSFSVQYQIIVVLKGAHTCITTPDGNSYFNSTGNPGMATAGSGDVLTGIIAGLLSQGYSPKEAVIMAVYIHGYSGDYYAKKYSMESLIAGNIIEYLHLAFQNINS